MLGKASVGYTEREMIGNNRGVTQASTVNTRKMLHEGKISDKVIPSGRPINRVHRSLVIFSELIN